MGGAPYKSAKEGCGLLFQMFPHLTTKEHPCHVYSNAMLSKQIIGQAINVQRTSLPAASRSIPGSTQHSEQHHVTMSMV